MDDYGLADLAGNEEADDADLANDDTFGDLPTIVPGEDDFDFNHERMARLHEEFLGGAGGAGFFGEALQDTNNDFMLEAGGGGQQREMEPEIDLDAYTRQLLDEPEPPAPPIDDPGLRNGLRVAGLPANLDEVQVKQLLSHFGPLSTFTLQRTAFSGTALLSYQDPAVAKDACASLHGIPLGGSTLEVNLVDLAAPAATEAPPGAAPVSQLTGAIDVGALETRFANLQTAQQIPPTPQLPTQQAGPQQTPPQSLGMAAPPVPPHPSLPPQPSQPPVPPGQVPPQMHQAPPAQPGPAPPHMQHPQQMQQALQQQQQQIQAAMQQMAHLPPAQQQALMAQMVAHQQRVQQQLAALNARPSAQPPPGAPGYGPADKLPARVGMRMSGYELELIVKHQAMQLQMTDPVRDDFYHHFWVMKGGRSQVKRSALGARKTTVSTERKPAPSEIVTSLGAGAVASRAPSSSVRTPKPLIQFGASPAAEEAAPRAPEEAAAPSAAETASPLGSERWVLRRHIDEAREALVELRVHASSSAVMTPAGQQLRHSLLQRLFDLVHTDVAGKRRISSELFKSDKGKKLLADLLPLWTPSHVQAALLAFASQLPEYVQQPNPAPHVPSFSSALASAPKQLPAEDCAALLEVVTAHGSAVLRAGLQFQELCALLLGLLCHTASAKDPRNLASLTAFYGLLVPLATTCERVWAVLNAVLPTADSTHSAMLAELIGQLSDEAMGSDCRNAKEAFSARLQSHQPAEAAA